jgi:hypothetical protein
MKAVDLFGVVVRTTGLFLVLFASHRLLIAALVTFPLISDPWGSIVEDAFVEVVKGAPVLGAGLLLMRFGGTLARYCYRLKQNDSDP